MIKRLSCLVAAWRTISDPLKLRSIDSRVCSMMFFTPRAAAMWKVISDSDTSFSMRALSRISPSMMATLPSRWAILAREPVLILSRMVTSSPRATRASAR